MNANTRSEQSMQPIQKLAWSIGAALLIIATACVLTWLARRYIVEPEAIAHACAAGERSWQCTLREWLVFGFTRNVFGIAAVIVGLFASISRWRSLAIAAMCAGVAGAVLYRYELSGVGLLLGVLTWVRPAAKE